MKTLLLLLAVALTLLGLAAPAHATWLPLDYTPQRLDRDLDVCIHQAFSEHIYLERLSPRWNAAHLRYLVEACMSRRGWTKS